MPRRKRDSDKPKRPLTAYMLFCQDKRQEIKASNPNVSFGEIGKLLGRAWQQLTPDDRKPYEENTKIAKTKYLEDMKEYKEKHPEGSDDERPRKRQKRGKGTRKKRDKNAPKKPCSAFFWFSKEQRPLIIAKNPTATFGEMGKLIGEAWRGLTDDDKKPYAVKAAEDKERYQNEMKNYKPPKEESSEESSSSESSESSSSSSSEESDESSSSESSD